MLSCALGFVTDVLINAAYYTIAGSAIQMLRGGKVIITALLSVGILGRRLHLYQCVGSCIVVMGITLVGVSTRLNPAERPLSMGETREHSWLTWKALLCCLAGELTQSVLWVYQESVLKKYDIPPMQLVGLEGALGVVLAGLMVVVAHPLGYEDAMASIYQLSHSGPLLASVILLLFSMAFFNYAGVGVTKAGSAVHRSIIDVSRSVVIWTVELALTWHTFSFAQFGGFCVVVLGALVYNRIIVVPRLNVEVEELPMLGKPISA